MFPNFNTNVSKSFSRDVSNRSEEKQAHVLLKPENKSNHILVAYWNVGIMYTLESIHYMSLFVFILHLYTRDPNESLPLLILMTSQGSDTDTPIFK